MQNKNFGVIGAQESNNDSFQTIKTEDQFSSALQNLNGPYPHKYTNVMLSKSLLQNLSNWYLILKKNDIEL